MIPASLILCIFEIFHSKNSLNTKEKIFTILVLEPFDYRNIVYLNLKRVISFHHICLLF